MKRPFNKVENNRDFYNLAQKRGGKMQLAKDSRSGGVGKRFGRRDGRDGSRHTVRTVTAKLPRKHVRAGW